MIDSIRDLIRGVIRFFVKKMVIYTGDRITPNIVTVAGTILFVPIAICITENKLIPAAFLLIVFGLLDTVDGELARLKKITSDFGIFLDASTDRIKESILYFGLTYYFFQHGMLWGVLFCFVALSGSMLVSYVKAKGEMVLSKGTHSLSAGQLNRIFQDGLMRYEIRITLIIAGLLFNMVFLSVVINALFAWITAFHRIYVIGRRLH
jgi:CDP-diacylglycerol---glycerol-3-phosphate 3-phosphatidyltransferase